MVSPHPEQNRAATPPTLAHGEEKPNRRIWYAGTLAYSASGLTSLCFWLFLCDFAWSTRDRSISPMAQWFLTERGVPNALFAILLSSIPALLHLVLGPYVSIRSDRHRGRLGRRIPFLLLSAPPAVCGIIGLGLLPIILRWAGSRYPELDERLLSMGGFILFWMLFEIPTVISQSVFGGLVNDVVPRAMIGRFYGCFRAISLLDGIIFNYWIIGYIPTHFTIIITSVGLFYGIAITLTCLKVKEGEYPPPASESPDGDAAPGGIGATFRIYFRECFGNSFYVSVFLLMMASSLTFSPLNLFSIPYGKSLGVSMDAYGKSLALTYGISFAISFFLGWLADHIHPLRVIFLCLCGYALVALAGSQLSRDGDSFLVFWVLHGVFSGAYFTSVASLGARLFPRDKFAQFNSAASTFVSLGGIIMAPLMGGAIDWSGNRYHYSFYIGFVASLIALLLCASVYGQLMRLGDSSREGSGR